MRSEAPMSYRLAVTLLLGLVPLVACAAVAQTARVGAHYGVNLSDGHWEDERLGAQASVHIVGPLETAGAFSVLTGWPGATGFTGSAWQAYWTMRVRPRGPLSFASVGYGFVLLHSSLRNGIADAWAAGPGRFGSADGRRKECFRHDAAGPGLHVVDQRYGCGQGLRDRTRHRCRFGVRDDHGDQRAALLPGGHHCELV